MELAIRLSLSESLGGPDGSFDDAVSTQRNIEQELEDVEFARRVQEEVDWDIAQEASDFALAERLERNKTAQVSNRLLQPTISSAAKVAAPPAAVLSSQACFDSAAAHVRTVTTTTTVRGERVARSLKQVKKPRRPNKHGGRASVTKQGSSSGGGGAEPSPKPPRSSSSGDSAESGRSRTEGKEKRPVGRRQRPGQNNERAQRLAERNAYRKSRLSQEAEARHDAYDAIVARNQQRSRSNSAASSSSPGPRMEQGKSATVAPNTPGALSIEDQMLQAAIQASLGEGDAAAGGSIDPWQAATTGTAGNLAHSGLAQSQMDPAFRAVDMEREEALASLPDDATRGLAREIYEREQQNAQLGRGALYSWAFAASLAQDTMKQKKEARAKAAAEAEATARRLAEERRVSERERCRALRATELQSMRTLLGAEPDKEPGVFTVAVKMPCGSDFRRRFRVTDSLMLLQSFVTLQGAERFAALQRNEHGEGCDVAEEDYKQQSFSITCTQPDVRIIDFTKTFGEYGIKANVRLRLRYDVGGDNE